MITGAPGVVIPRDHFVGGTISVAFWCFMVKSLPDGLQAEKLGLVPLISRDLTFLH